MENENWKPQTKWTKAAMLEEVSEYAKSANADFQEFQASINACASLLSKKELFEAFFEYKGWRETWGGGFCRYAAIFGIDGEYLDCFIKSDFNRAAELKSWQKMLDEKTAANKMPKRAQELRDAKIAANEERAKAKEEEEQAKAERKKAWLKRKQQDAKYSEFAKALIPDDEAADKRGSGGHRVWIRMTKEDRARHCKNGVDTGSFEAMLDNDGFEHWPDLKWRTIVKVESREDGFVVPFVWLKENYRYVSNKELGY